MTHSNTNSVTPIELQETNPTSTENKDRATNNKQDAAPIKENEEPTEHVQLCGWKFPFKWYHILTMIGWFIMLSFMIYYTIRQSMSYVEAMSKPTTTMSWIPSTALALPAVTVCNWNAGPSDCNACEIRYNGVVDFQSSSNYNSEQYYYKEIEQGGNKYHCFVFNNISDSSSSNLLKSTVVGYNGVRTLYFGLNTPTPDEMSTKKVKMGFIVSFHDQGTTPNLLSETNYALPALDNFFMLTKVITTRLKPTIDNPNLNSTKWNSEKTVLRTYNADETSLTVSVTYSSLSTTQIEEVYTNSIEGLLGELAGMIGLLVGIDLLKMIRGFLEVPFVFKEKSTMEFWDNFN